MGITDHDAENRWLTANIGEEVQGAIEVETSMGFRTAIKLYPKAVAWPVFFSLGVIMTGFDPQIMGNLYGVPKFQEDFGYLYKGKMIISAAWQSGLSMGSPIGQVVGALAASYPMEWFGRKWTFLTCVILTAGCVFIQFFARSLPVLLVGELLGGLVLGCYAVIAPAYASEVCPVALRGVLTAYINMCFVIGQFIANGIAAATHGLNTHWAYSIPFSIQWGLGQPLSSQAMIIETDRLEQEMEAGTTYWDCFKRVNLRRTEIAIGVYTIQVFSGIYLIGYSTYFFTLCHNASLLLKEKKGGNVCT
ncbi:conserved hypothetical protein [Uncinocarpus reesii 1704]|uniref:Major facilitator superfamily (MFS) profile domain-containing protein n=1 Tax=Uncinocarpus reesii (strain UAMH 1704) TaxID=336963 RepID=C4JEK2_UNCRE|nr:uncharacterized protein UREG_00841 [Uncinocarpus reesii 1704]EEP75994.1 conserved hypothetical protein [Uncinocarpus reesii 1704]